MIKNIQDLLGQETLREDRHASPVVSGVYSLVQKDLISLCSFHLGGDLGNQLEESDLMSVEVKIADLGSACWTVSLL